MTLLKKNKILFIFIFLIIGSGMTSLWFFKIYKEDALYVGVAGPFSGNDAYYGKEMIKGIDLCINEINSKGGINGKKVRVIKGDDMNKSSHAMRIATQFSNNKKILFVLGHYTSSASFAGGRIYMKSGIPAITSSATADNVTLENEWYFRTIFTNKSQAEFIAHFIRLYIKKQSAMIIFCSDLYSTDLTKSFIDISKKIGLKIEDQFEIDMNSDTDKQLNPIIKEIKNIDYDGVIFLAMSSSNSFKVIKKLKYLNNKFYIFGPDSFANDQFKNGFKKYPLEKAIPGYYINGIFTTSNGIFGLNLLNKESIILNDLYYRYYKTTPSLVAASYYESASLMMDVLKNIKLHNKTSIKNYRRLIKNYLSDINKPGYAIKGISGNIYFDKKGDAVKAIGIGRYVNDNYIPFYMQYTSGSLDIEKADKTDKKKLNVVYVSIEIVSVELKKDYFDACFFINFTFNEDFDTSAISFKNVRHPVKLGKPVNKNYKHRLNTITYKVNASFSTNFDYHKFPFDQQILDIAFKHNNLYGNEMKYYAFDVKYKKNQFHLPGWQLSHVSSFGLDTKEKSLSSNSVKHVEHPGFHIQIHIKRYLSKQLIRYVFTGGIILLLLFFAYFIPLSYRFTMIIIPITSLVFIGKLYINFKDIHPGYLTLYDHWFISLASLSCLFLFIALIMIYLNSKSFFRAVNIIKITGIISHLCFTGLIFFYYLHFTGVWRVWLNEH
ncbi:branched-chain amino acid ABC transporter substrate-binding protein [Candidatus Magnetomorum sp. HK-1]|nr:branched-chain amino acid ABC transporter substrate-binding protein [Candidatus Magnetomorum sp. HK-1]